MGVVCIGAIVINVIQLTLQNPARRSCSFGDRSRSPSFPMIGQTTDENQEEEGSSRQRRITIGEAEIHLVAVWDRTIWEISYNSLFSCRRYDS